MLQLDLLGNVLHQTFLEEDSSCSYSAASPYSPDCHHGELEVLQYPLEFKTESPNLSAESTFYYPGPFPDTQYQDMKPHHHTMMFPFFTPGLSSVNPPKLVSLRLLNK